MFASRGLAALLSMLLLLSMSTPVGAQEQAAVGAVVDDGGCRAQTLARNDDGSTRAIDLPFTINFYGIGYEQVFVNNNGNVTFDAPLRTYTPFGLAATSRAIVAPFFGDVDTRGAASREVTYGETTFQGNRAFCVNWVEVGYYPAATDRLNSFQLLLVERPSTGNTDFDIVFNYDAVEWETGGASGGSGGLGGASARVGFSSGQGTADTSYELPGSGVNGAFLDDNLETGLVHGSRGASQLGRYVFSIRNGSPNYIVRRPSELFGFRDSGAYVSDPVHTGTGNFTDVWTDLDFADGVMGLDWQRTYNSRDERVGVLGPGWSTLADVSLEARDNGAYELRDVDGRNVVFEPSGDGYSRPEEFDGELSVSGSTATIEMFDGTVWTFGADRLPDSVRDWTGQEIVYVRGPAGRLDGMVSSTGYEVGFVYEFDRLVAVEDNAGRTVSYQYDSGGRLVAVVDAVGGRSTFDVDDAGRVAAVRDADGRLVISNVFDSASRVVEQQTATGNVTTFTYDDLDGRTTVTDGLTGESTIFAHDEFGRVVAVTDTTGAAQRRTYDTDGNLLRVVDRRGAATVREYDQRGNLTAEQDASGDRTVLTYDTLDRLVSRTDAAGSTWTMSYEAGERIPSEVVGPDGATTQVDVVDGLITSITDADGVTDTFGYDAARNLVAATNGVGDATAFDYDAAGRLVEVVLPSGAATQLTVDAMGRVTSETDAAGATTTTEFTPGGLVGAVVDPTGARTEMGYDTAGRLVELVDAHGQATTYAYDDASRLTSMTAPGGATTSYSYGPLGRLEEVTGPEGGVTTFGHDVDGAVAEATSPTGDVSTREFDLEGRLVAETDPEGNITTFTYDELDRLVSVGHPDGTSEQLDHDAYGRVTELVDQLGATETRGYTAAGRLAEIVDPVGDVTSLAYDDAGRLSSVTDGEGGITELSYTPDGDVAAETSPSGLTTSYAYDPVGRLIAVTDPGGDTTTAEYTLRGELERLVDPTGAVTAYSYDALGRLVEAVDANGGTTTYGYDARGNRTSRTNALGHTEAWSYDLADRLVASVDQLGNTTTASYDAAGRLVEVIDPTGRVEQLAYDSRGLLTAQTYGDGTTIQHTYDAMGRRTAMTDPTGTTTWAHDAVGNLTEVTTPTGHVVSYAYDAARRRTATTYPDGRTVTTGYDGRGLPVLVDDPQLGVARIAYDADGRVVAEELSDGRREFGYDDAGELSSFVQKVDGRDEVETLTWDAAGRLATRTNGKQTADYTYDTAGQLLDVAIDGGLATGRGRGADDRLQRAPITVSEGSYAYDAVGNRTQVHEPDNRDTSAEFDAAGRLLSTTDGDGGVTTYTYDAAGRRVGEQGPEGSVAYTYDARGMLAEIHRSNHDGRTSVETRTVDGDGRLTATALVDGRATKSTAYTWDQAAGVEQVLHLDRSVDASGRRHDLDDEVDLTYVGDRRLGFVAADGTAGSFATDPLGNAIETPGTTGLVAASIYTPYGTPVESTGTTRDDTVAGTFGFRGELATSIGLHLRAREYDTATGQFLTIDPLDGLPGLTVETSAYHYANNDPVNFVDPLGLRAVDDSAFRASARRRSAGASAVLSSQTQRCGPLYGSCGDFALDIGRGFSNFSAGLVDHLVLGTVDFLVPDRWWTTARIGPLYNDPNYLPSYNVGTWTGVATDVVAVGRVAIGAVRGAASAVRHAGGVVNAVRSGLSSAAAQTSSAWSSFRSGLSNLGRRVADETGSVPGPRSAAGLSTPSSRALGANLEAAGATRPAGAAAHHIVAGGSRRAEEARAVLARFGIDINAAENGVFLPRNRAAPNPTGAAVHSTLHTNAYYSTVNDLLLSSTTRSEALDALAYIRQSLLGGGL